MYFKIQILIKLVLLRINKWWFKNNLCKLQQKRWEKLNATLIKSPFYYDLAKKNTPLNQYPILNKKKFMLDFDKINTKKILLKYAFEIATKAEETRDFSASINSITVGLSTGTSGNRGVFLASESERAQWVACILDRVIGISIKKRNVAFFLRANSNLYDSVKSKVLQFEFFDIIENIETHIQRLNKLQPDILVAQPSVLLELTSLKEKGHLNINPKKIVSVAEVLYDENKILIEKAFNQKIHQVYQCTEGLLATTCSYGTLHFNDDFLIIEKKYLDNEKKRFHPVITDLMRTTQPIIRYELNDIIHEKTNCPCGSNFTAIERIEGRSDDVLKFATSTGKEIKIYPDFLRRIIVLADSLIYDYTLTQKDEHNLELYIGNIESYNVVSKAIKDYLASKGVNNTRIHKSITSNHIQGNKLIRIRNDWKTN